MPTFEFPKGKPRLLPREACLLAPVCPWDVVRVLHVVTDEQPYAPADRATPSEY